MGVPARADCAGGSSSDSEYTIAPFPSLAEGPRQRASRPWLLHNGPVLGRREFLASSAAMPSALLSQSYSSGLRLAFEASALPALPAPLDPGPRPSLVVEFRESGTGPLCALGLGAEIHGEPCLMPMAIWTASARWRRRAREALHLPAFLGNVTASRSGWSLSLNGEASFSASFGGPLEEPAGLTPPWVAFRHALSPDWTQDRLVVGEVQLWSQSAEDAVAPVALAMADARVEGALGGWLARFGAGRPMAAARTAVRPRPEARFVEALGQAAIEPLALRNYSWALPRSVRAGRPPTVAEEREVLRSHSEMVLPDLLVGYVDCVADPPGLQALIPPPCTAHPSGTLRVLAIRGLRDPALDEAWLFARCDAGGRAAWYAVSHLAQALAGSEFGREVLGYPTKHGTAHIQIGGNRFLCSVQRQESQLFEAYGSYGGFSTGTSLEEMLVASLRPVPGRAGSPPGGEIVLQPWFFQGLRKPVSRQSLVAAFPPRAAAAATGAWGLAGPVRPYYASILDGGAMQRLPGKVVATVEQIGDYYRDRCDGTLPWEIPLAEGSSD